MNHYNFWKIIATMWPETDKETLLIKLVQFIDIFRINLSHVKETTLERYIEIIQKADSSKTILLDTKWAEIRTKNKENVVIPKWYTLILSYEDIELPKNKKQILIKVDYDLTQVPKEATVFLGDNLEFEIYKKQDWTVLIKIESEITITPGMKVSFKGFYPDLPILSQREKKLLRLGINRKANMVAISFVKDATDIAQVREYIKSLTSENIKIIAKIETQEAIKNIDEILEASDGIMIARWDLGVNLHVTELPRVQLNLLKKANEVGKPVIIAGEVLASMVHQPFPTRAEIDGIVFNLLQWADAFVLSNETAIWKYPLEAIQWLREIIISNQDMVDINLDIKDIKVKKDKQISDYIANLAIQTAKKIGAKAIICPTETWYTASRLASFKSNIPIIAFTKNEQTFKYLNLLWGVKGVRISGEFSLDMIKRIGKEMIRMIFKGTIRLDDKILLIHSTLAQNVPNMINGIEVFKFKDM